MHQTGQLPIANASTSESPQGFIHRGTLSSRHPSFATQLLLTNAVYLDQRLAQARESSINLACAINLKKQAAPTDQTALQRPAGSAFSTVRFQ